MPRLALWAIVIGALLLFGLARLPLEKSLDQAHRAANLRTAALDIGLREEIGQLAYAAALSGFRSLVAAFLWIEAHTAWEQTAWGRMAGLFQSVTSLQPRSLIYWDLASWHMASNFSSPSSKLAELMMHLPPAWRRPASIVADWVLSSMSGASTWRTTRLTTSAMSRALSRPA